MPASSGSAAVVGSGPNGLAAAITLAQAGVPVVVYEAESIPGGGVRTLELTLPGFRHDFGSAVYPMGVGSPFFRKLPLAAHGLDWIHSPAAMAHPLDDGTAVLLMRDLDEQSLVLEEDGAAWRRILEPLSRGWWAPAERCPHWCWRGDRSGANARVRSFPGSPRTRSWGWTNRSARHSLW
jgi:phytoene dehydrogenase-like protein